MASEDRAGLSVSEAAVFGLLGLILAFTFGGASARRDDRRELIAEEANAIGTAWLRLDLLPAPERDALRADFRRYLDARLAAYRAVPEAARFLAEIERASRIEETIWTRTVAVANAQPRDAPALLLLPALNAMFDIVGLRDMALVAHPPSVVFALLFALAVFSSLLAGFGMAAAGRRSVLHMVIFAVLTSLIVYVIVDLEYPRLGLIRLDAADQMLVQLRRTMG